MPAAVAAAEASAGGGANEVPTTAAAAGAAGAADSDRAQRRAAKRRRWFKTVAVVMARRGGTESHRFVDIANGVSEFHFGRTTTRYDGSLLVGPVVPAHGFEVTESVHAALALTYPPGSRHLHAPRALLEVMVGGQPQLVDGRIFFVQITPVRLLADPDRYAALHRELFGVRPSASSGVERPYPIPLSGGLVEEAAAFSAFSACSACPPPDASDSRLTNRAPSSPSLQRRVPLPRTSITCPPPH